MKFLSYGPDSRHDISVVFVRQDVVFALVGAEDLSEVSLKYLVSAVPTFVLVRDGKEVERVEGADAASLTATVKKQVTLSFSVV